MTDRGRYNDRLTVTVYSITTFKQPKNGRGVECMPSPVFCQCCVPISVADRLNECSTSVELLIQGLQSRRKTTTLKFRFKVQQLWWSFFRRIRRSKKDSKGQISVECSLEKSENHHNRLIEVQQHRSSFFKDFKVEERYSFLALSIAFLIGRS